MLGGQTTQQMQAGEVLFVRRPLHRPKWSPERERFPEKKNAFASHRVRTGTGRASGMGGFVCGHPETMHGGPGRPCACLRASCRRLHPPHPSPDKTLRNRRRASIACHSGRCAQVEPQPDFNIIPDSPGHRVRAHHNCSALAGRCPAAHLVTSGCPQELIHERATRSPALGILPK